MDLKTNLFGAYDRHVSQQGEHPCSPGERGLMTALPRDDAQPNYGSKLKGGDGEHFLGHHEAPAGEGTEADDERMALARHLGMDPNKDKRLMWIAEMALKAPLPEDWNSYETERGEVYYHKPSTGETSWDHPNDQFFRTLYHKTKEQENASLKIKEAASLLFRSSMEEGGLFQGEGDGAAAPTEPPDFLESPVLLASFRRSPDGENVHFKQSERKVPFLQGGDVENVKLGEVLKLVEQHQERMERLEMSLQAMHQAVIDMKEDHNHFKTDGLGAVQAITHKLESKMRQVVARMRRVENKQNCDSVFSRLASNPNDSWRSTNVSSWKGGLSWMGNSQDAGELNTRLIKRVEESTDHKITGLHQQVECLKRACRVVRFYQAPCADRAIFLSTVGVQIWMFICASVLLAMAADSARDRSGGTRDAFRAMLHLSKGAEGMLLFCVFDFLNQLLVACPGQFMVPITFARAAIVRIVAGFASFIYTASSLRLAAVLVYARKIPIDAAESTVVEGVLPTPTDGLGLGILDSYIADKSLDPAGICEAFLISTCMLLLLDCLRRSHCEQVPLFAFLPAVFWASIRFSRGIVLSHSLSLFARRGEVDADEDNMHGVVVASLQLLECCAGAFAFSALRHCCQDREDCFQEIKPPVTNKAPCPDATHNGGQAPDRKRNGELMGVQEESVKSHREGLIGPIAGDVHKRLVDKQEGLERRAERNTHKDPGADHDDKYSLLNLKERLLANGDATQAEMVGGVGVRQLDEIVIEEELPIGTPRMQENKQNEASKRKVQIGNREVGERFAGQGNIMEQGRGRSMENKKRREEQDGGSREGEGGERNTNTLMVRHAEPLRETTKFSAAVPHLKDSDTCRQQEGEQLPLEESNKEGGAPVSTKGLHVPLLDSDAPDTDVMPQSIPHVRSSTSADVLPKSSFSKSSPVSKTALYEGGAGLKHPHLNRIGSAERKDGMGERFQEDEDGGSLHGSSNLQEIQRLTQKFAAGSMGSAVKRSTYTQSVSSTSNAFSTVRSPTHENFCKEEATTTDLKLSDLETPHLDNKNEKKERDTFDGKQSNGHGPIEPTARNSLEGSLLTTPNTSYHLDAVKRLNSMLSRLADSDKDALRARVDRVKLNGLE